MSAQPSGRPAGVRYGDARIHAAYCTRGFGQLIPLHTSGKGPLVAGHHGGASTQHPIGDADRTRLIAEHPSANVGLVLPPGVVGLDVDAYGDKPGAATLAALQAVYGPLAATWRSSARPAPSGIYLFGVPLDLPLRHVESWIADRFGAETVVGGDGPGRTRTVMTSGIEIIRSDHRYAQVYPSVHAKLAARVMWHGPDGAPVTRSSGFPEVGGLPGLPDAWQDAWRLAAAGDDPLWDRSGSSAPVIARAGRPATADAATRRLYQLADRLAGAAEGEVMCGPELANQLPFWAGGLVRHNGLDLEFATSVMAGALDGWTFAGSSRRAVETRIAAAVRDGAARCDRGWTEAGSMWDDETMELPGDDEEDSWESIEPAAPALATVHQIATPSTDGPQGAAAPEDWDDQEGPLHLTFEQADGAIEGEFSRLRLAPEGDALSVAAEVVEQLCRYAPVFLSEHEITTRVAACYRQGDDEGLAEVKQLVARGHGDLTPIRLRDDGFEAYVRALAPSKREADPCRADSSPTSTFGTTWPSGCCPGGSSGPKVWAGWPGMGCGGAPAPGGTASRRQPSS